MPLVITAPFLMAYHSLDRRMPVSFYSVIGQCYKQLISCTYAPITAVITAVFCQKSKRVFRLFAKLTN